MKIGKLKFILLASTLLGLTALPAMAQSACAQLGVNCGHPNTGGGGGGYRGGGNSGPTQEDIEYERREARRLKANALIDQGTDTWDKGEDLFKSGDYAGAAVYFQQALDIYKQSTEINSPNSYFSKVMASEPAVIAFTQGLAADKRGDSVAALAFYQQASADDPSDKDYRRYAQETEAAIKRREATSKAVSSLVASAGTAPPATVAGLGFMAPDPGLKDAPADNAPVKSSKDIKSLDEAKAMGDTSKQAVNAPKLEKTSDLAGETPTNGGGDPSVVVLVNVGTPEPEKPDPPAVAAALAKDPTYQKLGQDRAKAVSNADEAQKQLNALTEKQKTAPSDAIRVQIQIQMGSVIQKLNTAKGEVQADDANRDAIKTNYVNKITMLPAPGAKQTAVVVPLP